jgi:hypothetical protein
MIEIKTTDIVTMIIGTIDNRGGRGNWNNNHHDNRNWNNNRCDNRYRSAFDIRQLRIKEYRRNHYSVELCGDGPKRTKVHSQWRGNTFFIYLDSQKCQNGYHERNFNFDFNLGPLPRHGRFTVVVIDEDINRSIGELEF